MTEISEPDDVAGGQGAGPDPSLSLPRERLAGRDACPNCGTALHGAYCHHCGQPDRRWKRFFPLLLRDLLADAFNLDSRLFRTLVPLVIRPGQVTRDLLDGRRARHVPPLRLYLFSSLVFFLLASLLSAELVTIRTSRTGTVGGQPSPERMREAEAAAAEAMERVAPLLEATGAEAPASGALAEPSGEPAKLDIRVGGKPWDRETNPVRIGWLPDRVNDWINDEIEESPEKARQVEENPALIQEKIREVVPGTAFALLPVAALLFVPWYLLARRYYVEHLIFALHGHSFVFAMLSIQVVLGALGDAATQAGLTPAAFTAGALRFLLVLWLPVYFLLAMKRVYGQGWIVTALKCAAIGASYLALVAVASGFVALVGFVAL